jgi:branched-chain amino acid transport system permease protein
MAVYARPPPMETLAVSLLNGLSYGLLLFMLSSGLTLIFSMMGVLNFAHAAFYMLGAYLGYSLSAHLGFASAMLMVPLATGLLGAAFERHVLRRVHALGHVPELLATFGLGLVLHELVQLIWGSGPVNYRVPVWLDGPLFTLYGTQFPLYRAFIMAVALAVLALLGLMLRHSRLGLVVQAALTHPQAVQALGHDVPRVFMAVFGVGSGLAGLAGVLGGNAFVTEPGMAATLGSVLFVVIVVGGMGSLTGALLASLLIGLLQTLAVGLDQSLGQLLSVTGPLAAVRLSQLAPVLPFALMVAVLVWRPRGLLGRRE